MPTLPKGTYPIATFLGGDRYARADELALLDAEGPTALGEGLLAYLGPRLAERGIEVGAGDGSSSGGWEMDLRYEGARFWLNVGCLGDPNEQWSLTVDEHRNLLGIFSRSHPEQLKAILGILHDVLRSIDGIANVRWYEPDDWKNGRDSVWHPHPVDT